MLELSTSHFQQWKKEKLMLDVFVTSPILIDQVLFENWLAGSSAKQIANQRRLNFTNSNVSSNSPSDSIAFSSAIIRETYDHFRNFELVERYLQHPNLLEEQSLVVIDHLVFKELVKKYYAINDDILRLLAGRKLKGRTRSSLDESSERWRVPIAVARRQFDNLKRVYAVVTEKRREGKLNGSVSDCLEKSFLMPSSLAERYARNVFLCYNQIETDDKRLRFLTAKDMEYFASIMMSKWTHGPDQLEMDRRFKEDLREVRTLLLSEKVHLETYKQFVTDSLKKHGFDDKRLSSLNLKFSQIVKVLLNIAAGMLKTKEFEDIFEDIEEKVTEVFVKMEMTEKETSSFFNSLCGSSFETLLNKVTSSRHKQRFYQAWIRYCDGIRDFVLHMFAASSQIASSPALGSSYGSTPGSAPTVINVMNQTLITDLSKIEKITNSSDRIK
eukprot:TRINITY_DN6204_c0_g1_i8.p2 TRINITY_DN6204_c0_g1~~TRINITY_DN6204_c0_g1_i8.p2  ORF type:complete len:442 (-),score=111.15 TRINITY_DN6204_c0_g1_i8:2374-3699(-)